MLCQFLLLFSHTALSDLRHSKLRPRNSTIGSTPPSKSILVGSRVYVGCPVVRYADLNTVLCGAACNLGACHRPRHHLWLRLRSRLRSRLLPGMRRLCRSSRVPCRMAPVRRPGVTFKLGAWLPGLPRRRLCNRAAAWRSADECRLRRRSCCLCGLPGLRRRREIVKIKRHGHLAGEAVLLLQPLDLDSLGPSPSTPRRRESLIRMRPPHGRRRHSHLRPVALERDAGHPAPRPPLRRVCVRARGATRYPRVMPMIYLIIRPRRRR